MANNINWGKIYESTAWGNTDNNISWGKAYADLAGVVPALVSEFVSRVEADGGSVESTECLSTDLTFLVNNPEPVAFTGLLNDYSGAAAAYSLRLLDNTYTGDAIVVRRASDNTTQAIGFVNNELDTTSLESFCSGTDGFVTTWYDQSGNANNATQATASEQPQIVSAGSTILENGKPTLSLDHTLLHKLVGSNGFDISNFSHFSVAKQTGDSFLFSIQTSNSAGIRQQVNGSTFTSRITTSNISVTSSPTANNQFLLTSLYDGTNGYTYLNNTQSASATLSVSDVSSANMEIGSASAVNSSTFGGTIQEMIFYQSNESTNRSGIETNINDFYTIY